MVQNSKNTTTNLRNVVEKILIGVITSTISKFFWVILIKGIAKYYPEISQVLSWVGG